MIVVWVSEGEGRGRVEINGDLIWVCVGSG